MGYVGSSDHIAVLAEISFKKPRPEKFKRQLWMWRDADWPGMSEYLNSINWEIELQGDIEGQVSNVTNVIMQAQWRFVPSKEHEQCTSDQPWFGPRCRAAAKAKHQAWRRLKRHPSDHNKQRHREATRDMQDVQEWATQQWKDDTKLKFQDGRLGSKKWWSMVKNKQGTGRDTIIPPITTPGGELLLTSSSKADKFAEFFSGKMKVDEPNRPPPTMPCVTSNRCDWVKMDAAMVKSVLLSLDTQMAIGQDLVSPLVLKRCAQELAEPLCHLFNGCLE